MNTNIQTHPFELSTHSLEQQLEEMVDVTIGDLGSEFLLLPTGQGFLEYTMFRDAYECVKRHTEAFTSFQRDPLIHACVENSRSLAVIRTILGITLPEWAELAVAQTGANIPQTAAHSMDRNARLDRESVARIVSRIRKTATESFDTCIGRGVSFDRLVALLDTAVVILSRGAPPPVAGIVHRLYKFDTTHGLDSVHHAATNHVPYAMLLYERYLGRPFAGHRDAVSELVGEVMENAIEDRLRNAEVTYRKTGRAERLPGWEQAPDFFIPDETSPIAVIEAKITSDDGTARDKVARIIRLAVQQQEHVAAGIKPYEVIACIDGRGFRERREDRRQMLRRLDGKVFTTVTLDHLLKHTAVKNLISASSNH